jgi:hypothetical protein
MRDEFDEAALDFARFCLKQTESYLGGQWRHMEVRPDGYNSGPESFSDNRSLQFDDIGQVLPIVAYWCSLNTVTLEISYSSGHYSCRFTAGNPLRDIIETNGSANICHELLSGVSYVAKQMKVVNEPHTSMRWNDFIEGRESKE